MSLYSPLILTCVSVLSSHSIALQYTTVRLKRLYNLFITQYALSWDPGVCMGRCTCTRSLYVNRTFLVGVVVDILWTLQLLDLLPLDSQRVSVGVQIRNSAWMKWIVSICSKQIQYIYQYFSQYIPCCVKKHYYSLFNPDIHVKGESQSRSHGCLIWLALYNFAALHDNMLLQQ